MSAPLKVTPEFLEACTEEAKRRSQTRTNKELATMVNPPLSPKYVAQVITKIRRQMNLPLKPPKRPKCQH